jgi:hypothetical protein
MTCNNVLLIPAVFTDPAISVQRVINKPTPIISLLKVIADCKNPQCLFHCSSYLIVESNIPFLTDELQKASQKGIMVLGQ